MNANQSSPAPLWRSMLYVPVTAERFVAKAHERGADAIKLDLEDSIAPSEKPRGRSLIRVAARTVGQAGADVLVRINRPWRMAVADLEASIWPEICGIVVPKVESADHLGFLVEIIEELEAERGLPAGHTCLVALIETARGFANVREIAKSTPRLAGMSLGQEDFCAAIGLAEPSTEALLGFVQQVQVAAREAGVMPLGYPGSIADFTDLALFGRVVRQAASLGFEGGSAIHPNQVALLNEAFSPSQSEIVHAEGLVVAYDQALADGLGAVTFEGKMIDVPIYDRAKRVLRLRDRIRERAN